MKKRSRFYYNLVEITLAMAVVGIGIAGIMALFVPALDSSRESVAENYSSQVAESLLAYIEKSKRNNWESDAFYKVDSAPGEVAALTFKESYPDTTAWATQRNSASRELLPGVFMLDDLNGAGIYGLTLGGTVNVGGTDIPDGSKFCAIARVWKTNVGISSGSTEGIYAADSDSATKTIADRIVNGDGSNPQSIVRINVEISYPATVPPANRKKSLYILEIGKVQ